MGGLPMGTGTVMGAPGGVVPMARASGGRTKGKGKTNINIVIGHPGGKGRRWRSPDASASTRRGPGPDAADGRWNADSPGMGGMPGLPGRCRRSPDAPQDRWSRLSLLQGQHGCRRWLW